MKIIRLLSSALVLILMASLAPSAGAQTEKELLENMIKAMGGRENLAGIRDTRMSGTIEIIQFGMTEPVTIYTKEPNKFRMEMEIMGMNMIQVFDGHKAMMTNPQTGEIIELPPDQTQQMMKQAMGNEAYLNPEKYGITYTYKGREEVDGKTCYVLEQRHSTGDTVTLYLDAGTNLIYKTRTKALSPSGGEIEAEQIMSDYRKVGNVLVSFSVIMIQGGAEFGRITINEVVFNTGLEDSLFTLK